MAIFMARASIQGPWGCIGHLAYRLDCTVEAGACALVAYSLADAGHPSTPGIERTVSSAPTATMIVADRVGSAAGQRPADVLRPAARAHDEEPERRAVPRVPAR